MKHNVVFAYEPQAIPIDSRLTHRAELFGKLQTRELAPVVSLGAETAFSEEGLFAHDLFRDALGDTTTGGRYIATEHIGLIMNRLNRSMKVNEPNVPAELPPMINENATRRLAWRKERVHNEVLGPLGLDMPTRLISTPEDIDAFISEHGQGVERFIVKSRHGNLGKGMAFLGTDELRGHFHADPKRYGKRVIQPAYDFTLPLPGYLKPYDAASREAFEGWNVAGKVKEMRVYGFYSPAGVKTFPAARATNGEDNWFFVDPETVPLELYTGTADAITKAAAISGALALYGAVDFGFGRLRQSEPRWRAIELNGLAPYLIGYDKHAGVADNVYTMLADQIQATVYRNSLGQ